MALIDFLGKALETFADVATSNSAQRNMEKGYKEGKLSQEDYNKYRNAVDNYKRKKGIEDDDY